MCGIVGVFLFNNLKEKAEKLRTEGALFIFTELLQTTSARGEDATGVTTLFENGDYMVQKMGIASPDFISRFGNKASDFEGYLNLCRKNDNRVKALIGHCRKSSVGNTIDNENNHPIKTGEIIGIHNGTLKNHNKIFKKLDCKRDGVVDSEAIFRLLQHFTDNCKEPFTLDMLEETTRRLDGSYSCIAYNANNPYQIGIFRDARPMEFALIKSLNIMLIASEKKFIDRSIYDYNKQVKLYKTGAPLIRAKDISFAVLPNNNVGLIDLTQHIGKNTKLADIVLRKDTFKSVKLWQLSTVSSYYNRNNNFNRSSATTKKLVSASTDDTNKKEAVNKETNTNKKTFEKGKVFCKELNKFVEATEIKTATKIGCVEILNNGKTIIDVEKKEIVVEDAAFKEVKIVKKEVDVSMPVEIIEESKNSKDSLLKYNNNVDLANDIDAKDEKSVAALAAFALGNRIRKHTYENAFIDGAKFYKEFSAKETINDKLSKAQKNIRLAKKIINVLALNNDLSNLDNGMYMSKKARMKESFEQEDASMEITVAGLNCLITEGDKRDCPTLALLENVVKEETDGKTNTVNKI